MRDRYKQTCKMVKFCCCLVDFFDWVVDDYGIAYVGCLILIVVGFFRFELDFLVDACVFGSNRYPSLFFSVFVVVVVLKLIIVFWLYVRGLEVLITFFGRFVRAVFVFTIEQMFGYFVAYNGGRETFVVRLKPKTARTFVLLAFDRYCFVPHCDSFANQVTVKMKLERSGTARVVVTLMTCVIVP